MKRILLFLFILASLIQARASDTLTVRQVFNFNVGDAFEYGEIASSGYYTPYINFTVSNKLISANNDTIGYVRSNNGTIIDTLIITHLDSSIISVTDSPYNFSHCPVTLTSDSACSAIRNTLHVNCGLAFNSLAFIEGLGKVDDLVEYDDNNYYEIYLIYYTKAGATDTTPYISVGINNIPNLSNIKVYPNPTTDLLHLSITDAGATNAQFIITDILGQQVYISPVSQSETTHDVSGLTAGIYTWKLVTDGMTIKTGKVVKQ